MYIFIGVSVRAVNTCVCSVFLKKIVSMELFEYNTTGEMVFAGLAKTHNSPFSNKNRD